MLLQLAMKPLRVGRADERVSPGGVISLAFRNSMMFCNPSCNPARVSCVATLGCNEAGELMFASGKLPVAASAASPSAMPPKTIKRIKGKHGSCMILFLEFCISTSLYLIFSTVFKQNSYHLFGVCSSP